MVKLNNSSLNNLEDIIKGIKLNYDPKKETALETLSKNWIETIGNKISKFSKVYEITSDNILKVVCSDSIVANELYKEEEKILKNMNKKMAKTGIELKGIQFNYRKWEESKNE